MNKEKFRISIIDFLPHHKAIEVGVYGDGTKVYIGDCVTLRDDKYVIVYRYGKILLKEIGMIAMLGDADFDNGDFSGVEKTDVIISGEDWLIIGYVDENKDMYELLKQKGICFESVEIKDSNSSEKNDLQKYESKEMRGIIKPFTISDKGKYVLSGPIAGSMNRMIGRLVQVRKKQGMFGTDVVIVRESDGTLRSHENQFFWIIDEEYKDELDELFKDVYNDNADEYEYSIGGSNKQKGFLV